jgi:acyl dehydratase
MAFCTSTSLVAFADIRPYMETNMSMLHVASGQELPPLVKPPITQEQLRRYAEASGDYNPIHLDEEAAHRVGLDSVIAHGMLSMAFLGQFVTQQIADTPGALLTHLRARFINMVRLDDTLTCHGVVKSSTSDAGQQSITIECWAQNQKGEKVTTGEATIQSPLTRTQEASA